jgi:iron transport multicopper oxidase
VRIIDSVSGAVLQTRTLDPPFSDQDEGCGDTTGIGITGTPFIDPATDIMYFYAKSYFNGQAGPQGTLEGMMFSFCKSTV